MKKQPSGDLQPKEDKPKAKEISVPTNPTPHLDPKTGKKWKLKDACLALRRNEVQSLDLTKLKLGSKDLAEALGQNKSLLVLNLVKTGIGPVQLKNLKDSLAKHPSLTSLNLARNGINSQAMPRLLEIIQGNKNLRILNLAANKIGKTSMREFCELPVEDFRLTTLSLAGNPLGNERHLFNAFTSAFLPSQTLTHVDFTGMNLKSTESGLGDHFYRLIEQCPKIKYLNLSSNNLEIRELEKIAKALEKNNTLSTLNLSYNYLLCDVDMEFVEVPDGDGGSTTEEVWTYTRSSIGIKALQESLKTNQTLRVLHLDHLKVRKLSMEELDILKGIAKSPSLTTMSILGSKLKKDVQASIQQILQDKNKPDVVQKKKLSNKKEK